MIMPGSNLGSLSTRHMFFFLCFLDMLKCSVLRPDLGFTFEFFKKSVTDVALDHFDQLEAGDVFFVDSSHLYTYNSDVRFEFADILPRLKKGVVVHVRLSESVFGTSVSKCDHACHGSP
jgi:hypothetical protein